MSGFDPVWLDMREGPDHRARNSEILAACAAHFGTRDRVRIVDLGCGLGSNLRALAPHLPARQSWRLVDHDPVLLDAARDRLARWADSTGAGKDGALILLRDGKTIEVSFVRADLAKGVGGSLEGADLVTAAALFDLVSKHWMQAFVSAVVASRTPFYTVLTYDGVETWSPPHPQDAAMLAAFHQHQARDKGFGPAAGPGATAVLATLFESQGYVATQGASPWRLGAGDRAMIEALANGVADACAETGLLAPDAIAYWRAARLHADVLIGHLDLFARPA